MEKINYQFRAVLVLLAMLVSLPGVAFAQEQVGFKISPTTIEDKIDPGSFHAYTLTVQNTGTVPATLYPIARNITGVGADYHPIYSLDTADQQFDLASWVRYQETELSVEPGESKTLHFSIQFPEDAHPGSHMAGIFLSDKPSDLLRNGSAIGYEVGAIMNFQVAGDIIENTQIREFFPSKTVYGTANVLFTLRLENSGNVLSRPRGIIDITNMFGRKVASLPVNDDTAGVFPNTTREFTATWSPDDLQIGRYEAVVALSVDGITGNQTISRVVQFWVLPMNILMPVFGTLFVLVLAVYIMLRMYVRRQLSGVRSGRAIVGATGLSRLSAVVMGLLVAIILGLLILFLYFG